MVKTAFDFVTNNPKLQIVKVHNGIFIDLEVTIAKISFLL